MMMVNKEQTHVQQQVNQSGDSQSQNGRRKTHSSRGSTSTNGTRRGNRYQNNNRRRQSGRRSGNVHADERRRRDKKDDDRRNEEDNESKSSSTSIHTMKSIVVGGFTLRDNELVRDIDIDHTTPLQKLNNTAPCSTIIAQAQQQMYNYQQVPHLVMPVQVVYPMLHMTMSMVTNEETTEMKYDRLQSSVSYSGSAVTMDDGDQEDNEDDDQVFEYVSMDGAGDALPTGGYWRVPPGFASIIHYGPGHFDLPGPHDVKYY